MSEPAGIPCVTYAAKSTEDRRESISGQLADERVAIGQAAGRRVVCAHTDEAFSAYQRNRGHGLEEARQRAQDLAADGSPVELSAQHSDRLANGDGRRARHAVEIAFRALKKDVKVRTIQDPDTFRGLL